MSAGASDAEKLRALLQKSQKLRAMLPELLQRLASVDDRQSGRAVFYDVAQGVGDWQAAATGFAAEFSELKPTIEQLEKGEAAAAPVADTGRPGSAGVPAAGASSLGNDADWAAGGLGMDGADGLTNPADFGYGLDGLDGLDGFATDGLQNDSFQNDFLDLT